MGEDFRSLAEIDRISSNGSFSTVFFFRFKPCVSALGRIKKTMDALEGKKEIKDS